MALVRYTLAKGAPAGVARATVVVGVGVVVTSETAVEVTSKPALNLSAAAFLLDLVLIHSVLKWLHHPLVKYVML